MTTSNNATIPTPNGSTPRSPKPAYQLKLEPDGRSWTLREDLADILEREILGPAGGPDEILDGVPDAAYLIGRIAPVRLTAGKDDPVDADTDAPETDVGDGEDAHAGRGVPLTAVDDSSANTDEDTVDDEPQKRGLMIPASMGLRFQIPVDQPQFTVQASWGVYTRVHPEGDLTDLGSEPSRLLPKYQRTPVEIDTEIAVTGLTPGHTTTIELKDRVVLRVDRYDDAVNGCHLIEVALCNDRETPRKIPVDAWMYQTKLLVTAGGAEVFLPVVDRLKDTIEETDSELRRLNLQYRNRLEFAIGRTCSVDWAQPGESRRTSTVWTTWIPTYETPQTEAEEVPAATLDMVALAHASAEQLEAGLRPIATEYHAWLDEQDARADQLPEHLRPEANDAIAEARKVEKQLLDGLEHLVADSDAQRCFRFMNQVMAEQRIQSQVGALRGNQGALTIAEARANLLSDKGAAAHSWRTFQLAFILMQLPLLTDPSAAKRSGKLAKAQLLFFPTGGGKTEAYLGLAAYAFAVRRLHPNLAADTELNGGAGVTVLMRYTLRLLTSQQFQRASTLVCAAEMERRRDPATWGDEPFRIGLWVGTDVSPKRYDEAVEQISKGNKQSTYRLPVLQVERCPWCGTRITARDVRGNDLERRVHVYCGDELGDCPFAEGGLVEEGLPILTVDEEIYRLAPSFVIATVDKFARLAREGEAASLFGYVSRRCGRHGYVHTDYAGCTIKDGSKHNAKDGLPAAGVHPVTRLRPPDLIIQDELHLISGALGTSVGLFEVGIDVMASWRTADGDLVRPLLVASTATARNAGDQIRALYARDVTIFPPQVLDAGQTFFSKETPVSDAKPGRRYVGLSTTGVRLTTAEIRVAEVLMAAGQLLLDRGQTDADPYLTLVGYFSATRELAGMNRYLGDDVQTSLSRGRPWSLLPRRTGTNFGNLNIAELTARVSSRDINGTLDQMAVAFDPDFDSTESKRNRSKASEDGKPQPQRDDLPFDAVLATSMLQVGVDVTRLGLMLVVGQPKNTAEYIQATSRVGRDPKRCGLVVTLGNWARPRDLAHFEQFRHYHETFYAQVEALSVTPFSPTSLDRGLQGVLVSAARVMQASTANGLSPERSAGRIKDDTAFVNELIEALIARVLRASGEDSERLAKQALHLARDQWLKRRDFLAESSKGLAYERIQDEAQFGPLLISPENAAAQELGKDVAPFRVANSMREVQNEINLLVSPMVENLVFRAPPGAPTWVPPRTEEKS
ncbi:Helicase conserved C-terminal domain-containing protein [Frankineae bacterium MT45]|nr:Helicase conserved C-terminal domain-containing protein [Frankineae bacterium MT45]